MDHHMERTQIYLSRQLKQGLSRLAVKKQSNVSELLRKAAQRLLEEEERTDKNNDKAFKKALKGIAGIWAERDPKEFLETRRSLDRKFPEWND